jgi:hypothetical protein
LINQFVNSKKTFMKIKFLLTGLLLSTGFIISCKKGDDTPAPTPEPAPTVTAISPSSGPKNTAVTITGTNFGTNAAALKVYFNGVQGTIQSVASTSISATVPAGASTGAVKVEKNGVQVTGPVFTYFGNGMVTTFAGSAGGFADGTGTAAQFLLPAGIVKDASGNFFVTDRDNHRIRKITSAGVVTVFAGSGTAGFTNGTGTAASFNQPYALAIDAGGNLYVGDRINHAIRKITPAAVVTTLAGDGSPGSTDGTGSGARFNEPLGLAVDAAGNVFAGDYINNRIRKITPAGVVTTFAGSSGGFVDGTGTGAAFNHPFGIAFDASGNLFVGDSHNFAIRKITPGGVVSTFAGSGSAGSVNGTGTAASFNRPAGITVDASGNVYVCDLDSHTIRKITAAGVVTTLAGTAGVSGSADATGAAAAFVNPLGICVSGSDAVYVADANNNRIRKIVIE